MNRLKQTIVALALVLGLGAVLVPQSAAAINLFDKGCAGQTSEVCTATRTDQAPNFVRDILNTLFYVIGIVAVIMIIFGAFRYVTSGGDAGAVTAAKNTIFYAVIGLIIALLAYAIVNFVINAVR